MSPAEWLRAAGAQKDVVDGLARYTDWPTLWKECPRGDWLLGIAERLGVDHTALVRAAIGCARVVEADAGEAAALVLTSAERWTEGKATASEVATATLHLDEMTKQAADPASEAAARAALAVGLGVADRAVLASAPAAASESVMMASIDCGFELAMRWAHDKCVAAVRDAVPWALIAACVDRLEGAG